MTIKMQESKRSSVSSDSKKKRKEPWPVHRNIVKKRPNKDDDEDGDDDEWELHKPIKRYKAKKRTPRSTCGRAVMPSSAEDRAQEVQDNLSPQFPSFVKLMLPSHISGGYWLGLQKEFCDNHLPDHDKRLMLVDEDGETYYTKYLVNKNGLSGGWKGFSLAHKLVDGDALVFQLIEPYKFKVYIIRANKLTEADGAATLLNLESHPNPMDTDDQPEERAWRTGTEIQKYQEPLLLHSRDDHSSMLNSDEEPVADKHGDGSDIDSGGQKKGLMLICYNDNEEHSSSETSEAIPTSVVDFKDVKRFQDFTIQVDGLNLNSVIPSQRRRKYYLLCCSQNRFLHEHLINGLTSELATGVISETINIADAITEVTSMTPVDRFESWNKTLKAFEELGMDVGFLRARIRKLVKLSQKSESVLTLKRSERAKAENELRRLEEKMCNARTLVKRLDVEIDSKIEELDSMFVELAGASW